MTNYWISVILVLVAMSSGPSQLIFYEGRRRCLVTGDSGNQGISHKNDWNLNNCNYFASNVKKKFCQRSCPTVCKCKKKSAECENKESDKRIRFIPNLPQNISSLSFQNFYLTKVTHRTFKNLMGVNLKILKLKNNHIESVAEDAFSQLFVLDILEITQERLVSKEEISRALFHVNRNIKTIRMTKNPWDEPPSFIALRNSSVNEIDLSSNNFQSFSGTWFLGLHSLKLLFVGHNYIDESTCNFTGIENVEKLSFTHNLFKRFPSFCNYKFNKNLQELRFDYNRLTTLFPKDFECLPNLIHLNLGGNPIYELYNDTFSGLPSLQKLSLNDLARKVSKIEPLALRSDTLQDLGMADMGLIFAYKTRSTAKIFKHCQNVQVLDLSDNVMKTSKTEKYLISMLSPLKRLTHLFLNRINLHFIPEYLISLFPQLKTLQLSGNHLKGAWNSESVFGNTSSLTVLDLSYNNIEVITPTTFPTSLLNGLDSLNLRHNQFSCFCSDVQWFNHWLRSHQTLVKQSSEIRCVRPHRGQSILDLTDSAICPMDQGVKIAITIFSSIIIVFLLSLCLVYKLRWHVRHWLYIIKIQKNGYDFITDDPDFNYDLFLIFADEDRNFVLNSLVTYLEKRGFRLCIRYRDFELGRFHVDNIVDKINLSRRVLLVLSNNFARSTWCEFQLEFAYNRCLEEKRNNVIVTALEEISYRYLTNTLRVLLTSHDYALWSKNDEAGQTLFWQKVLCKLPYRVNNTETAQLNILNHI